jgi:hypothetical protein
VLDAGAAGAHGARDGPCRVGVRAHVDARVARLFDHGGELSLRELEVGEAVRGRREAARGHDPDVRGALARLPRRARRGAPRGRRRRRARWSRRSRGTRPALLAAAAQVAVPARLRQRLAAEQQSRALHAALGQRLRDAPESAPPQSRTVVNPRSGIPRKMGALRSATRLGASAAGARRSALLAVTCTCASSRPGTSVSPPHWTTSCACSTSRSRPARARRPRPQRPRARARPARRRPRPARPRPRRSPRPGAAAALGSRAGTAALAARPGAAAALGSRAGTALAARPGAAAPFGSRVEQARATLAAAAAAAAASAAAAAKARPVLRLLLRLLLLRLALQARGRLAAKAARAAALLLRRLLLRRRRLLPPLLLLRLRRNGGGRRGRRRGENMFPGRRPGARARATWCTAARACHRLARRRCRVPPPPRWVRWCAAARARRRFVAECRARFPLSVAC